MIDDPSLHLVLSEEGQRLRVFGYSRTQAEANSPSPNPSPSPDPSPKPNPNPNPSPSPNPNPTPNAGRGAGRPAPRAARRHTPRHSGLPLVRPTQHQPGPRCRGNPLLSRTAPHTPYPPTPANPCRSAQPMLPGYLPRSAPRSRSRCPPSRRRAAAALAAAVRAAPARRARPSSRRLRMAGWGCSRLWERRPYRRLEP